MKTARCLSAASGCPKATPWQAAKPSSTCIATNATQFQGEELPTIPGFEPFVELGGSVTRVKTYGELVTAIINPSHKLAEGYAEDLVSEDGKSKMYVYNGFMTVQELTDLVMFLQPHYDVVPPEFHYRVYP